MIGVSPYERAKKWHDMLNSEDVTMMAWSDMAALAFILVWASMFRRSSGAVAFDSSVGGPEPTHL